MGRTQRGLERFFVKNLENVQGDERDVIFISTVYGPTTHGGPVQNRFGPVNGAAGPRRLNVLFSRAKQQIVTFSSMNAEDIKATEGDGSRGAYLLKRWLQYSATGVLEAGETDRNREPDSEFERYVIEQVEAMGCEAVPQVGVAGYFIDIGVRHAEWPHGFLLGVECDGAAYHSAKSARDRDRLRQEVLEGLGWRLFRIWSTDWFENPPREAAKLREAIYARLAELKAQERNYLRPTPPTPIETRPSPSSDQASKPDSKPALGGQKGLPSTGLKSGFQKDLPFPEESPPKNMMITEAVQTRIRQGESGPSASEVEIGDTVRIRYLEPENKVVQITISRSEDSPSTGIVHYDKPIARAILGAEEGEEVEVLIGAYVKPARIEKILTKGTELQ